MVLKVEVHSERDTRGNASADHRTEQNTLIKSLDKEGPLIEKKDHAMEFKNGIINAQNVALILEHRTLELIRLSGSRRPPGSTHQPQTDTSLTPPRSYRREKLAAVLNKH